MLNQIEEYDFLAQQFTKYVGSSLYLICLFGTLMNIIIFSRKKYNHRASSLYLLFASLCDLLHINLGLLTNILQYGFDHDWTNQSINFCKTKTYFVYVLTIISASLTISASINQYLLSSKKPSRWNYTKFSVAFQRIKVIIIVWVLISVPIIFCTQRYYHYPHKISCSNPCRYLSCRLVEIIFNCILNGVFPPLIMLIFGILTYQNVHELRRRSKFKTLRIQQINQQLTLMLILQSIKSICMSIPYSIFNYYSIITLNKHKTLGDKVIEKFLHQIVYLLFWSNYTSFIVYFCSSKIFREQCRKILYCLTKRKRKRSLSST